MHTSLTEVRGCFSSTIGATTGGRFDDGIDAPGADGPLVPVFDISVSSNFVNNKYFY
jgi:hypothetical protein